MVRVNFRLLYRMMTRLRDCVPTTLRLWTTVALLLLLQMCRCTLLVTLNSRGIGFDLLVRLPVEIALREMLLSTTLLRRRDHIVLTHWS